MVNPNPQSDFESLLDEISGADPSKGLARKLAGLAANSIAKDDAPALLVLAEQAARIQQWQAAAQLFALTMVAAFTSRFPETDLAARAQDIVLFMTEHEAEIGSTADLLLYSHRRLMAALRADGLPKTQLDEWTMTAIGELLKHNPLTSVDRNAAMKRALGELHVGNQRIGKHYQAGIGRAHRVVWCALQMHDDDLAWIWVKSKGRLWHWLMLSVVAIASVWVAALFQQRFPLPMSDALNRSWLGWGLRTALVAWPGLLIGTWLFAFFESSRTRTLHYLSPSHLLKLQRVISGEVTPFSHDWFFHIFQFIWIGLLVFTWMLFRKWQGLPGWLPAAWDPNAKYKLGVFLKFLTAPVLPYVHTGGGFWSYPAAFWDNDLFPLLAAVGLCIYSIGRQCKIQKERIANHTDFYWWDVRVNRTEWWVRLIMVGVDMFLVGFLVAKVLMVLFAAYHLVAKHALKIEWLAPDGVGGLSNLTDLLMYISWIVFLFGLFVFASLYLHWNLREYRKWDLTLVFAYIALVALMVAPVEILDHRLAKEKEMRLEQIAATTDLSKAGLKDAADYVKNIESVRDWKVSAVTVGILGNPVLPLGFQFVVIVLQSLGRAGKLPKIPAALLSGESESKSGHDGG
jgi:hypothetical protein